MINTNIIGGQHEYYKVLDDDCKPVKKSINIANKMEYSDMLL